MRFNFVFVWPCVLLQISFTPAKARIFAHSFSTQRPFPLGAGIKVMRTEPQRPVTAKGMEVGSLEADSHVPLPRRTRIRPRRAERRALSLDGTVSPLLPMPI